MTLLIVGICTLLGGIFTSSTFSVVNGVIVLIASYFLRKPRLRSENYSMAKNTNGDEKVLHSKTVETLGGDEPLWSRTIKAVLVVASLIMLVVAYQARN
ncbi:hypothetical protein [Pseudomonas sp. R9.37]|uniref:hypothetical protein n=1 Tax=Pseudomonas sp. R9.37 TaxID=1390498 RepID=UPI000D0CA8BE|nr:hypothetical protein [Pseudomonas sp. R9.37]PSL90756.1 hypothetical protein C7U57_28465 [Pseudomonas sp. R9.37]